MDHGVFISNKLFLMTEGSSQGEDEIEGEKQVRTRWEKRRLKRY